MDKVTQTPIIPKRKNYDREAHLGKNHHNLPPN